MNRPKELEIVCRIVAITMMAAPMKIAVRRPRPSVTYGEMGYAQSEPIFYYSLDGNLAWKVSIGWFPCHTWIALNRPSYRIDIRPICDIHDTINRPFRLPDD